MSVGTISVNGDSGLYAIVMSISSMKTKKIGKLDSIRFEPGTYIYAGSAMRAMSKRMARHRARNKKLRWHIDYFRTISRWENAVAFPGKTEECELANRVESAVSGARAARNFGASDCRCPGHLIITQMSPGQVMAKLERLYD